MNEKNKTHPLSDEDISESLLSLQTEALEASLGDALAEVNRSANSSQEAAKRRLFGPVSMPPESPSQEIKASAAPLFQVLAVYIVQLLADRHALYGDNYHRFGPIMKLLIGNQKINPASADDMARLGIFVQIVGKITRYGEQFDRGGHDDSLDDMAVYAMMLKELDNKLRHLK